MIVELARVAIQQEVNLELKCCNNLLISCDGTQQFSPYWQWDGDNLHKEVVGMLAVGFKWLICER